jgi:GR25 family glycosyltransferase involved in LPS biosynthesis
MTEIINEEKELPFICLNMIVKNEEHCIIETLKNVTPYIDYYIIVDTGSTDNTKKVIKEYFDSVDIKGEIYDEPWKDFGYNRSKALEYCSGKCVYAWVMDADDLVHGDLKFSRDMKADGYNVIYGKGFVYWRCQVMRMDKPAKDGRPAWCYKGILHEHPWCNKENSTLLRIEGDYFIESRRKGSRNKVANKYLDDAKIFEDALKKNPNDPNKSRYLFYLAQSYFDAKMYEKAIENYRKRINMGGWIEEVYYSYYRIAVSLASMGRNLGEVISVFLDAIKIHPKRAEPYYEIAHLLRRNKLYLEAYEYGNLGLKLEYDPEYLFCTKLIFDILLKDEVSISAYYIGEYKKAYDLSCELLEDKDVFGKTRERIEINKYLSKKKLDQNGEKEKPLLCFYTGYSTVYTKDDIYGSELSLHNICKRLAKDYRVVVFTENCDLQGNIEGVISLPAQLFEQYQEVNDIDIMIISRYICFFLYHKLKAKKTYIWIHDTTFQPFWNAKILPVNGKYLINNIDNQIDGYVCLTNWHKELISNHYSLDLDKIHVIGHGLDFEKFKNNKKEHGRFIYTSCPRRGLNKLLKLFPVIHKKYPYTELYIYRGLESFTKEQLNVINSLEYVHYNGCITHEETAIEFSKSDIWFYPTDFLETFCMTALEAQMGKCICITSKLAALEEVVGDRGLLNTGIYNSDEFDSRFLQMIDKVLNGEYEYLREKAYEWAKKQSWDNISKKWRGLLELGKPLVVEAKKIDTIYDNERLNKYIVSYEEIRKKRKKTDINIKNVLPIYVINLYRRSDRLEKFNNELNKYNLNYERFNAVDGLHLIIDDNIKKLFPLDISTEEKKYESHRNRKGVLGCGLSHYKLWKKMLRDTKNDNDLWIIFEDDVRLEDDFNYKFEEIYSNIKDKDDWSILFLGYIDWNYYDESKYAKNVYKFRGDIIRKHGAGAHAYCIRRKGAEYLVNKIEKDGCYRAIDWFIVDQFSNINCLLCLPVLATAPLGYDSDIMKIE